jgi:N-acetylneuraminate synthase
VRVVEAALGRVNYAVTAHEESNARLRRSLFVVADVKAGEPFTASNVRSIRPGHGLPPRHLPQVLGRFATRDIRRGTPLSWDLLGG